MIIQIINSIILSQSSYSTSAIIFSSITILILLTCSSLIAASEVAFFSLEPADKEQLKLETNKNAKSALELINKPQDLLATILITSNFVNVAIVIITSSLLNMIFPPEAGESLVRFIIDVFLITAIILLIGEVIPKVYATKQGVKIVKMMAAPLDFISNMPPVSWLRKFLVNGTKIIHRYAAKKEVKVSSDELEQILALTKEETTSDEDHKILEGIVKFGSTDVKQIMRPRTEISAIANTLNFKEVLEHIQEMGYSRVPVFEGTLDKVEGILHIKDLLSYIDEEETFNWQNFIRKPFYVPENKKLDDLLNDFQSKKMHMAIVVDEYGGTSGLATLEDILEEIVGDITDEFDEQEISYSKINDNEYIFEGKTALVDFYKVTKLDGKEFENNKGEADTLGGFIVEQAGRILMNRESIQVENCKLIVEASDKKRIKSIRVLIQEEVDSSLNTEL
jgi:gliding motility-associated protein GldE